MLVFLTGGTGWIGSAIIPDLLSHSHTVLALSRSDESDKKLSHLGATPHRGSIEDLDSLRSGAQQADGVIHCGRNWKDFQNSAELDAKAIQAIGEVIKGTKKPFIITSATMPLGNSEGRAWKEGDASNPSIKFTKSHLAHEASRKLKDDGVRSILVRLPPSVYGEGDTAFVPMIIGIAKTKGTSGYIGEGANRWPSVHRQDAVVLYRLALEASAAGTLAPGTVLHAVDENGTPFKELATLIGRKLDAPVVGVDKDEAEKQFGLLAMFIGVDNWCESEETKRVLGWKPSGAKWMETIERFYL